MTDCDHEDDDWDNDDDGYIACPHCGQSMLEDAGYCRSCDTWMTSEAAEKKQYSWWVVAVVLLLIVIMVFQSLPF